MRRSSKSPDELADRESSEEKLVEQLEQFVRVRKFFESKRSLSGTQAFTALIASVLVIGLVGLWSGFLPFYGIIIASVLSTIGITSMLDNMGNRSIRRFLERHPQGNDES